MRIRGSGKLLTAFQGLGLALLRSEQVEAVVQGQADLKVQSESVGIDVALKVQPWWPEAWPTQTELTPNQNTS
jgi:transferase CAF17, mitochondrial